MQSTVLMKQLWTQAWIWKTPIPHVSESIWVLPNMGMWRQKTEVCSLFDHYDEDVKYWTHHHNPRTVANNPAGEITVNLGLTGPHYTIGAACAAGNAGIIQGVQQLRLGECDFALAGGVSESIRAYGIFAGFKSQGALASHSDPTLASRPFDQDRNGIVVSEGGCIYVLERLEDAQKRGAKIIAEVAGYRIEF